MDLKLTPENRVRALKRFALTTTILSILGHVWLGFEQSYATPLVALLTAYTLCFLFEWSSARRMQRRPQYEGGLKNVVEFLLPPHIIALTCALFLFPGDRLWPVVFGTALAVSSRAILRIPYNGTSRHFLNPANFGILATIMLVPSVSLLMPYQFATNVPSSLDFILPIALIAAGSFINFKLTKRIILVASWLGAFALQACLRYWFFDASFWAIMAIATSVPAMLYTFFMISDPATTPDSLMGQIAFGSGIGILYGILTVFHQPFGLFWALFAMCCIRGGFLYFDSLKNQTKPAGNVLSLNENRTSPAKRKVG